MLMTLASSTGTGAGCGTLRRHLLAGASGRSHLLNRCCQRVQLAQHRWCACRQRRLGSRVRLVEGALERTDADARKQRLGRAAQAQLCSSTTELMSRSAACATTRYGQFAACGLSQPRASRPSAPPPRRAALPAGPWARRPSGGPPGTRAVSRSQLRSLRPAPCICNQRDRNGEVEGARGAQARVVKGDDAV